MRSDNEAIWDLLVHYCFLVDTGRAIEIPEIIFTENAIDDHGFGVVRGRTALREMFAAAAATLESSVHALSNHALTIDGDHARSRCYVTAWHWSRETAAQGPCRPADFVSMGAYVDELHRIDGRWLIAHRRCHLMGPQGLAIGAVEPCRTTMMTQLAANGPPADLGLFAAPARQGAA